MRKMLTATKNQGVTLIEVIVFVVALGIVGATIATTIASALRHIPSTHNQTMATAAATACAEFLLWQRYLNGFNFNSQTCQGGIYDTQTWQFCSDHTPAGFTTSVKISCTTVAIPNFTVTGKLIKVTTTGPRTAVLNLLVADY